MDPGRWGRITDIYHATIARPPEERASFLGEECHGDESLRKQVEAMVKSHEQPSWHLTATRAFQPFSNRSNSVRGTRSFPRSARHARSFPR
jgi:hypothetical protein